MNIPLRQAAHAAIDLGMANEMLSARTADHQEAVRAFIIWHSIYFLPLRTVMEYREYTRA